MTTPSAPPPGDTRGPTLPRPSMPPATGVPDDRVHGDRLETPGTSWQPPATPSTAWQPPAPSAAHPRRPRGRAGRSGRRGWLLVAGVGAAMVVGSANSATQHADAQETLRHSVTAVVLEAGATDVTVQTGASTGIVEVTRQLSWGLGSSRPQPDESWAGDTLRIGSPTCDGLSWSCSIDYVIRVPAGTSLTIHNGSGDIDVAGELGTVELKTGSGDISATGLTAQRVAADAGSGDIALELGSAPDLVAVETGSGDVSVEVPKGEQFRVTGDSGSGSRDIHIPSSAGAAHELRIQTGSGDVDVSQR